MLYLISDDMKEMRIRKVQDADGKEAYFIFIEDASTFSLDRKTERYAASSKEDLLKLLNKL